MLRSLTVAILVGSFMVVPRAFSQNNSRQGGQPGGPAAGAEEVPQGGQPSGAAPAPGDAQAPNVNDPQFKAQVSYGLGRNFAMNLKQNGIECDIKSLLAGVSDALTNAQPKYTEQQLDTCLNEFGRQMQQKAMGRMQQDVVKNQKEEQAFLAQNGKREGVQTTPSGLQYRVLQQGKGPSPTLNDVVKCNYRGTLLNGTEFDSSAQQGQPAEFPVKRVIPGWTEALQKMHVGDKWQLFVPAKLAYGNNPPGPPIEAGSLLVFEIELLGIEK